MKVTKTLAVIFGLFLMVQAANAQDAPKPYIVQTMYLNSHTGGRRLNLDSLLKIYKQNFMDPNTYVTSSRIVTHWWGHDSREVIFMYELKSLDDLDKAFEKQRDLQIAYMKDHKDFLEQFKTLMTDSHHSDEIYRVVGE